MKGKSIVVAALVGALTLGSSVFAFASISSDINLDTETRVSTSSDDITTSDDTSSNVSTTN